MKISLVVLLALLAYAQVHAQVAARISPEFFTVVMPPFVNSPSPAALAAALALAWPLMLIVAYTVSLTLTARIGSIPKLELGQVWKPLVFMLLGIGAVAIVAGNTAGMAFDSNPNLINWEAKPLAAIAPEARRGLVVVLFANVFAAGSSLLAAVLTAAWLLWTRIKLERAAAPASSGPKITPLPPLH